ncbi:rRNA processing/ribosome biogenesis-domain-containing protein [Coniochaeta sp. 2T2.1]|nr:rRNA processing/ribosome biogenesis-domain-containing protein [Coniochaeta sp. 2T2.1]
MSLPPDLRVLCRRLASTNPDELPRLCPVLVNHLLRCGPVLSAPHEAKTKDTSSDVVVHIHKLKTQINTLLNGKSNNGRFTAVVLIKAMVDVGGWECLRISEPWVRGLLSILQRPGATAMKELAIVTVTRIYSLLHGYQTLVREIASPTIPSFVNACLQLIKLPASGQPLRLPTSTVETVVNALATIVPLYPTTLRPFSAQIRAATKGYIAPTSSDDMVPPQTLRHASRRLLISLPYTAPKNGSGEEWAKAVGGYIKDCHSTADHVFRAVNESWESTVGYIPATVSYDEEPSGGSSAPEELPAWSGLQAGAERLAGLIELLVTSFRCPTKSPVAVPLGSVMDLVMRVASIVPPGPGRDDRVQLNASVGREEKDELWTALPDIHVAVLDLLLAMVSRLGPSITSLTRDILDHTVRISKTVAHVPYAREAVFTLAHELLSLIGPTLDKLAVDSLTPLIQATCRDLLESAGYLQEPPKPVESQASNGSNNKKPQTAGNADAFLNTKAENTASPISHSASHLRAARVLLTSFLTHLPQSHLSPDSRGLIDRTAILTADKHAMLASCLHPYRDSNGRYYASVMPFLTRAFPRDQEVEVLRSNLRTAKGGASSTESMWEPQNGLKEMLKEPEKREEETFSGLNWGTKKTADDEVEEGVESSGSKIAPFAPLAMDIDTPFVSTGSFGKVAEVVEDTIVAASTPMSPLKRKGDDLDSGKAKKVEAEIVVKGSEEEAGSDSDEEGSIQIDMTMDDDEEEDEEDNTGGD